MCNQCRLAVDYDEYPELIRGGQNPCPCEPRQCWTSRTQLTPVGVDTDLHADLSAFQHETSSIVTG